MHIVIVGLGLMGGSLCYALRGFRGATLTGVDTDEAVCRRALDAGCVDEAYPDIERALPLADVTIFCIFPQSIRSSIQQYAHLYKHGSIVTEICGVKRGISREACKDLPPHVDYVGIHPMAGKAVGGFSNADKSLFAGTGFIVTPTPSTKPESVELMMAMADHIGAARKCITPPDAHDAIIAYTSDLMHISAAALCMDFAPDMTLTHTAGAFRDCTRIADIDPALWTQLFLENGREILAPLQRFIGRLEQVRAAIEQNSAPELEQLLALARDNKREMQSR